MGRLIRSDAIAAAVGALGSDVIAAARARADSAASRETAEPASPSAASEPGTPAVPPAPPAPTVTFGPAKRARLHGPSSGLLPERASVAREVIESDPSEAFDVIIIGAGPAGLSAGLNLVRARRRVLMLDSNRPRHSATLVSHGFLTRDGVSPLELRKLGREEFERYPEATFHQALVTSIELLAAGDEGFPGVADPRASARGGELFEVRSKGIRGSGDKVATARAVILATGLSEKLPALPNMRAYYGTALHSCVECDGYDKRDAPLALIGETDDLAEWALLISQWSNDLVVFTNAVAELCERDEAALDARGISVERRPIADIEGDRGGMTGVSLTDGTVIPRSGGFVRPTWTLPLECCAMLRLATSADGLLETDDRGRTSQRGVFVAGDSAHLGSAQLIVAAGDGARVASTVNRHLLGLP